MVHFVLAKPVENPYMSAYLHYKHHYCYNDTINLKSTTTKSVSVEAANTNTHFIMFSCAPLTSNDTVSSIACFY